MIIKSDSDIKTRLLIELAEELGLSTTQNNFEDLDTSALAHGIGRKATDEELVNYLEKHKNAELISLDNTFEKYN